MVPAPEMRWVNGFVDGEDLVLLRRNERAELVARRFPAEWSSFHRKEELTADHLREIRNSQYVKGVDEVRGFVRVRWRDPEWRRRACAREGWFDQIGAKSFEADVDPVTRYFQETPGARIAKPRRLYLDIETDSRKSFMDARAGKARVLSWALCDDGEFEATGVLDADTDEAERALLEAMWRAMEPYDQVAAWNGERFDFPIIRSRSTRVGARAKDPRRYLFVDHLEVFDRVNSQSSASGAEKVSLKLEDVAQETIKEGKERAPDFIRERFGDRPMGSITWELWEAGGEFRAALVRYMLKDAKLLPKIERKTGYLSLNAAVSEACGIFPNTLSTNPIIYVDAFLLREGSQAGIRFPTRQREREGEEKKKQFAGAFVLESKITKGIAKDIHVVDFSGMYPSIIMSWNMSPETKAPIPVNGPIPEGFCRAPSTRVGFRLDVDGILSGFMSKLGKMRSHFSKLQATLPPGTVEWEDAGRLSTGYKVVRNSAYGVIGSMMSRYFDRDVAESTTQNGVWLIKQTIAAAESERWGFEAVYGDTDSCFFRGATRERMNEFVAWCNAELYPRLLRENGCRNNYIEIAYEKEFERITMTTKKRYAGVYRAYKGKTNCVEGCEGSVSLKTMTCDSGKNPCGRVHAELPPARGKPEIKGLEYRRGDAMQYTRELQFEAIQMLMRDKLEVPEPFVPLIERWRNECLFEPLALQAVQRSQSITKPLREYKAKLKDDGTPGSEDAHVRVARIMKERGEDVAEGTRIFYVVTDGSVSPMQVIPAQDYDGTNADRYYLWENQVWPPTQHLLEAAFPGFDWEQFSRVRPERARKAAAPGPGTRSGKGARAPEEQGTLFGGAAPKRDAPAPIVAAPFTPPAADVPFTIRIVAESGNQDGRTTEALHRIKSALARHPGRRKVRFEVETPDGVAILEAPVGVALSPALIAEVERAKNPA